MTAIVPRVLNAAPEWRAAQKWGKNKLCVGELTYLQAWARHVAMDYATSVPLGSGSQREGWYVGHSHFCLSDLLPSSCPE